MPQSDFSAQVSSWVAKTKARSEKVFKESAQRVVDVMQTTVGNGGNMPVDTGFLRASLRATLGEPAIPITYNPTISRPTSERGRVIYQTDPDVVSLVINGAKIGDTISAVFSANYAAFQEYGSKGGSGRRFVALAAQQWPRIVSEVCADVQSG